MFLLNAPQNAPNPWIERVAPAVEKAERTGSVDAYSAALDAAWRADDWQAGRDQADAAMAKHPDSARLRPLVARALWRAGRLPEAEELADRIPADADDPVALNVLIVVNLARGQLVAAERAAERLAARDDLTAADISNILGARIAANRFEGLADLLRLAQRRVNPDNGYPESFITDELRGLAEFFEAVGDRKLNRVTRFGEANMAPLPIVRLPGCTAMINGKGPFRMVIDTGGSVTLSLDTEVAEEIGLESIAEAAVRGVAGKEASGQAIVDELKLGGITISSAMTRIFNVRQATAFSCDGVIGTGLFSDARMKLDFAAGKLVVSASSERPGAGGAVDIRIVGDAKLIANMTLRGEPVAALLDSGADAIALSPSRLARLFPDKDIREVRTGVAMGVGGEGGPTVSLSPGVVMTFAGRKYDNVGGIGLDVLDTLLAPILGVQTDVLIGMPVFRDMQSCTVDFRTCRMWVEWLEIAEAP